MNRKDNNKIIIILMSILVIILSIFITIKLLAKNEEKKEEVKAYNGPTIRVVGEKTYEFSNIRDESDWFGAARYLYIFIDADGEYLWYENEEDALNDKNSRFCIEPCTEDGYLHCHD